MHLKNLSHFQWIRLIYLETWEPADLCLFLRAVITVYSRYNNKLVFALTPFQSSFKLNFLYFLLQGTLHSIDGNDSVNVAILEPVDDSAERAEFRHDWNDSVTSFPENDILVELIDSLHFVCKTQEQLCYSNWDLQCFWPEDNVFYVCFMICLYVYCIVTCLCYSAAICPTQSTLWKDELIDSDLDLMNGISVCFLSLDWLKL